jgi:tRNA(Ile)-lysidine synthase TilS/MesJ
MGLAPVRDTSNRDLAFRRNRVRHELLPLLDDVAQRDVHPPEAAAVERVLAVARGEARATEVGNGRRVARTGQRLRLESL